MTAKPTSTAPDTDVIVVGAGFAGLYLIHRLKAAGLRMRVFEAAPDLGGTWYWNRYPGARSGRTEPGLHVQLRPRLARRLAVVREVRHPAGDSALSEPRRRQARPATTHHLRHRVERAWWDDDESVWHVRTQHDADITARFLVMANRLPSVPKEIDIDGIDTFTGDVFSPAGGRMSRSISPAKRVAVVGTGSSAVQSIPVIARDARARLSSSNARRHSASRPATAPSPGQARTAHRRRGRLTAGRPGRPRAVSPSSAV